MRTLLLALLLTAGGYSPALAQSTLTSPGAIPPAARCPGARAGAVTGTGQTKPPGDPVGNRLGTRPDLERKSRVLDLQIKNGICKGC